MVDHRTVSRGGLLPLAFRILARVVAFAGIAASSHAQLTHANPHCIDGTAPACIGQWIGPSGLEISCGSPGGPVPGPNLNTAHCKLGNDVGCNTQDEIAHAVLIPSGPRAGEILIWTRCDDRARWGQKKYRSHFWNPLTGQVEEDGPLFEPGIPATHGPFCSAHAWYLTSADEPRLLIAGGSEHANMTCGGQTCGSDKTAYFDPATESFVAAPDLPEILYYPSVVTVPSGNDFVPNVVGGTEPVTPRTCGLFTDWWTLVSPTSWTIQSGTYPWHQYPRLLLLSSGDLVSAGHTVVCETIPTPGPYGGNPVQLIDASIPTAHAHSAGPDPNVTAPLTMGLHYANAVLMHTLQPGYPWDPSNAVDHYDLDRVLVTGGSSEAFDNADPEEVVKSSAQPNTLELHNGAAGPWMLKAPNPAPRVFGNWVLLPDGSVLQVGGQDSWPPQNSFSVNPTPIYYDTAERFDPQGPSEMGTWQTLARRNEAIQGYTTHRGYHSVAILVPDGSVALMGGWRDDRQPYRDFINAADSVEIFRPPYFFSIRPDLSGVPASIDYDNPFCVTTRKPGKIDYACLIGIGSATHHFDYGQRYVELMVRPNGPCAKLQVLPPPERNMAPEGYYLLFLVEDDGGFRIPSLGKFVLLKD